MTGIKSMKCPTCGHAELIWYKNRNVGRMNRFRCKDCYNHYEVTSKGTRLIVIPEKYKITKKFKTDYTRVGEALSYLHR